MFLFEDYICRENSRQIAIIDYLFSVNFYGSIFHFWIFAIKIDVYRSIRKRNIY